MPDELTELQTAYASGLWGFQNTTAPNLSAAPASELLVMRVSVPPWMARQWTVHLNAMRYASGVLPSSSQPPDNQVSTATPWKVRVRWGASEASEQALVDYMPRGGSFTVHGADVNVFLVPNTTGAVAPILSGFLTPSGQTSAVVGDATFTTSQSPVIGPSSARVYAVPDRAVGYRWTTRQNVVTAASLTFTQFDNNQAACQFDMVAPIQVPAQQEGLLSNKAGYVPLHPSTQFIQVFNTDINNSVLVGLQFLLDLG